MTLSVIDGPDVLDDFISYGSVKINNSHFVILTQALASSDITARLIQVSGGTLVYPDTDVFTPSGNQQYMPAISLLPDSNSFISCQLSIVVAGKYSILLRSGTVDTGTHTISMSATETELQFAAGVIVGVPTLLGLSPTSALLFYTKEESNGVDLYHSQKYRILTVVGGVIGYSSEITFKNYTDVSGTTVGSKTGYVVAAQRQIPDSSNNVVLVYTNTDTSNDGTFMVNAYFAGSSLLNVVESKISNTESTLNFAVDSSIGVLSYNNFVGQISPLTFGCNRGLEFGLLNLGEISQGFARLTSSKFLICSDGGASANVYIGELDSDYVPSVNTPLSVGASGDETRGVFTSANDTAIVFNDDFVVLISSDSGELATTGFTYATDQLYVASGVLGTSLQKKSDIDEFIQTVEGMAVDDQMGKVWVGSLQDNTVLLATNTDNFATWDDETDSLEDDTTQSLRRIN